MSTTKPVPRTSVLQLPAYVQGKSELEGAAKPIKLSSNESALGPSPKVIEAINAALKEVNRYPDGNQQALRSAIAETHELDPARIICGSGSAELLGLMIRSYVGPGDELVLSENSFGMLNIDGLAQGATLAKAPERDYTIDVDALLARVTTNTRMVAIANPNNPTGTYLNETEILRLHGSLPTNILLVLDAAYAEFVGKDDYNIGTSLVEKYDNVIMTRTFSKAYGLAGLRIGWGYFPVDVCQVVQRLRVPYNITNVAMAAPIAAVRDKAYVANVCVRTQRWVERITKELTALGLYVVPSVTNFYLIDFNRGIGSASGAHRYLESRGIIPRPIGSGTDAEVLRITIGSDNENEVLLAAMREYVALLG